MPFYEEASEREIFSSTPVDAFSAFHDLPLLVEDKSLDPRVGREPVRIGRHPVYHLDQALPWNLGIGVRDSRVGATLVVGPVA